MYVWGIGSERKSIKKYPSSQHKRDYLPQTDKGQGIRNKDKQRGKETKELRTREADRAGTFAQM